MKPYIIPNSQAELLLHRLVTERVPILAWFTSADSTVKAKMTGYLVSSSGPHGLRIYRTWPTKESDLASYLVFTGTAGSYCQYQDETHLPEGFRFKSGLRINMPNGDTLILVEIRKAKD